MNTNIEIISDVIDYIDDNLTSDLTLEAISFKSGYSKFHLHRMFSFIVGIPIHTYVKRRKLTEAARKLILTNSPIIDIALDAGYTSQQAFTNSFKKLYKKSPDRYRKNKKFMPIQLKFQYNDNSEFCEDRVIDINEVNGNEMTMIGYKANTAKGFWVIPICHGKLEKVKMDIKNRCDYDYIIGINDYADFASDEKTVSFDYYATVEVSSYEHKNYAAI